jgi:hypothetical protein
MVKICGPGVAVSRGVGEAGTAVLKAVGTAGTLVPVACGVGVAEGVAQAAIRSAQKKIMYRDLLFTVGI